MSLSCHGSVAQRPPIAMLVSAVSHAPLGRQCARRHACYLARTNQKYSQCPSCSPRSTWPPNATFVLFSNCKSVIPVHAHRDQFSSRAGREPRSRTGQVLLGRLGGHWECRRQRQSVTAIMAFSSRHEHDTHMRPELPPAKPNHVQSAGLCSGRRCARNARGRPHSAEADRSERIAQAVLRSSVVITRLN
jgi:hypothetical protein